MVAGVTRNDQDDGGCSRRKEKDETVGMLEVEDA